MPSVTSPKPRLDSRLIEIAIESFGRVGFDGSSTRDIAAAAHTTMSSITYHFGGKDGLYVAAARHIAEQVGRRMESIMAPVSEHARTDSVADARKAALALVDHFTLMILLPESAPWARFIVREQLDPSPAFEILYGGAMGPVLDRLSSLITRCGARSQARAQARVKAIAIIGQALVFRFARATLLRATGWADVGAQESAAIRRVVRVHTMAILNDTRAESRT